MSYPRFPKIPRLDTEFVITEKIDGTNGLIYISEHASESPELPLSPAKPVAGVGNRYVYAGKRTAWITPDDDNHGFAAWVRSHAVELVTVLGPGLHRGEWYGSGINRGYGLTNGEKRFMLFNVFRDEPPATTIIEVATVLDRVSGENLSDAVFATQDWLILEGSQHVPGYDRPEGLVIQNKTNRSVLFKVPFDKVPEKLDLQAAQPRLVVADDGDFRNQVGIAMDRVYNEVYNEPTPHAA